MAHVVVGAAGVTGRELVRRLAALGEQVIAADLCPAPADIPHGVSWVSVDLCRPESLAGLPLSADDTVYHFAARQYHLAVPRSRRDEWFAEVNVGGTNNLLQHMKSRCCGRLVYFSTDMVYGPPRTSPVTTGHPLNPAGPYGRSKKRSEEVCRQFRQEGMAITIMRPRLIIGPGRLGILEKLFTLIWRSLPVPLIGSGHNRYQMVSVHDCVSAAILAVKCDLPDRVQPRFRGSAPGQGTPARSDRTCRVALLSPTEPCPACQGDPGPARQGRTHPTVPGSVRDRRRGVCTRHYGSTPRSRVEAPIPRRRHVGGCLSSVLGTDY